MFENFIKKLSKKNKFKFALFLIMIFVAIISLMVFTFSNVDISLTNKDYNANDIYKYIGDEK